MLETNLVCADGDVLAETMYNYEDSFPLYFHEKEYTGGIIKNYSLYLGGKHIPLFKREIGFQHYDQYREKLEPKLFMVK